jgi:cell division septum initiation protein DivIVA
MDILHLVDRLEELFNDSRAIPFTRNVIVDEDRMLELIDQLRITIPEEVKKAQQLLAQQDRIVAQSKEEASRTVALARERAEQMADKDSIAQQAQSRSEAILAQARAEAQQTRDEADDYVIDSLANFETQLERLLSQVRNGIRAVQTDLERKRAGNAPPQQQAGIPEPETHTQAPE